jgi:hypothetical protein
MTPTTTYSFIRIGKVFAAFHQLSVKAMNIIVIFISSFRKFICDELLVNVGAQVMRLPTSAQTPYEGAAESPQGSTPLVLAQYPAAPLILQN